MTNSTDFSLNDLSYNNDGLIPAIAQDWLDGSILMFAWMNIESLQKTLKTKEVHYWSRSRAEIWRKGATSGNIQILKEIRFDCDSDVLLLFIDQKGSGACHTGERSCFFNKISNLSTYEIEKKEFPLSNACSELFNQLHYRKTSPKKESYTNYLLTKGSNTILKKIGEESAEFIMACMKNDNSEIVNEAADIIYHLQVALLHKDVTWREVLEVLANRRK